MERMSIVLEHPEEMTKEEYFTKLYEDRQNKIVNVRSEAALTSSVMTWSHRTTNCDVISTITTTVPIKNGNMNDIKLYNSNIK